MGITTFTTKLVEILAIFELVGLHERRRLVGFGNPHVRNDRWSPAVLCPVADQDVRKNRGREGNHRTLIIIIITIRKKALHSSRLRNAFTSNFDLAYNNKKI